MIHAAGAVVRAGVNVGFAGSCANTPGASPDGLVGSSVIACHVVAGRVPHASVAASRNALQLFVPAAHPAMMLASELKLESVSVSVPLGDRARKRAVRPVAGSTRFRAIFAALLNPGSAPPRAPASANWASE